MTPEQETSRTDPAPNRDFTAITGPRSTAFEPAPGRDDAGLGAEEVQARVAAGATNRVTASTSQSWGRILRRNALTRLNFLLVALGSATLATGSAPDATFLAIAVINSVVGAVQEARAKRTLDALAVLSAPRARVVRSGEVGEIPVEDVVVDDLLDLRPGDQVAADALVVDGHGEVDESLATGESEPVVRQAGDALVSGCWLVAGSLRARVLRVGADSYANQLAGQARRFSLAGSELMTGINQILRALSWLLVIVAPVLFLRQLQVEPWRLAVRSAVAGLVGMIPEGLVLLTTIAFLTAAVRLGRRRTLVQELPAVETLARVDALCMDKTGTLTEGRISFAGLRAAPGTEADVRAALTGLAGGRAANATLLAIKAGITPEGDWEAAEEVPFSSARKWSAATFPPHGTWVLGAPEVVGGDDPAGLAAAAAGMAEGGSRVLVVATSPDPLEGGGLPAGLTVVATVELHERSRPEARQTLAYFAGQEVTVRVISGDSPLTVRALAARVDLPGAERAVDARTLPPGGGPDLRAVAEDERVFGRVTPEQKRDLVSALRDDGHTVAMTGDGVNDVLALKEADLGVAMGSGSAIARGVSQVVLLDDSFDVLPDVVAEGRRVLTNVERVASLFLVKNVYSLLISLAVSGAGWPYPFLPRHLTLISGVAIGIPGFFLALAPGGRRFRPGFVRRVLAFSIFAGAVTALTVLVTYALAREEAVSGDASRTAAVMVVAVISLWVLVIVARPLTPVRVALVAAMAGLLAGAFLVPPVAEFFSLQHRPGPEVSLQALACGAVASALIDVLSRLGPMRALTGMT